MLAVLMGEGASRLPYSELGRIACLSVSEAHAAVRRLQDSMLINSSASRAAANNRSLYDLLELMDMLRGGRIRERRFAELKLKEARG